MMVKILRGGVSAEDFEEVQRYVERQGISVYTLVKTAVLEKVRKVTAPEKLRRIIRAIEGEDVLEVPAPQKIIEKVSICGITCIRRVTDKTTSMTIEDLEISVTATNADDAERLFKFARKEAEDLEKE